LNSGPRKGDPTGGAFNQKIGQKRGRKVRNPQEPDKGGGGGTEENLGTEKGP